MKISQEAFRILFEVGSPMQMFDEINAQVALEHPELDHVGRKKMSGPIKSLAMLSRNYYKKISPYEAKPVSLAWDCEKSPTAKCIYTESFDSCDICGQPDERK